MTFYKQQCRHEYFYFSTLSSLLRGSKQQNITMFPDWNLDIVTVASFFTIIAIVANHIVINKSGQCGDKSKECYGKWFKITSQILI